MLGEENQGQIHDSKQSISNPICPRIENFKREFNTYIVFGDAEKHNMLWFTTEKYKSVVALPLDAEKEAFV
jgi:hypothetical protein